MCVAVISLSRSQCPVNVIFSCQASYSTNYSVTAGTEYSFDSLVVFIKSEIQTVSFEQNTPEHKSRKSKNKSVSFCFPLQGKVTFIITAPYDKLILNGFEF